MLNLNRMERKLVFTDQTALRALKIELEKKATYYNHVLTQYRTFQKFRRVSTLEDAIELLNAPVKTFDKAVISSSNMPTMCGLSADINAVCTIYGIKRDEYIQALNNIKEKFTFNHKDSLKFEAGVFSIDEDRYSQACEKFNIYASTPEQLELVDHFETLVRTMNDHMKRNLFSAANIPEIARGCGLLHNMFVQEPFEIDYKKLADNISNIK